MSEDHAANVKTVYAELCSSYHQIDDFRSKLLLGFLPLATGGVFLFASDSGRNILDDWKLSLVIGLFGLFITLGLLISKSMESESAQTLSRLDKFSRRSLAPQASSHTTPMDCTV